MTLLELYYKIRKQPPPPFAKHSILFLLWKMLRKFLNVVIIPNIPFNTVRIGLYRMMGYRIGKGVFIGMKCYLDDLNPSHTTIEANVTISYGCYFSLHGKRQSHQHIIIKKNVYIGMRCNIVATKEDIIIGENSVVGAASLVNKPVPANSVAAGVPARIIGPA